MPPGGHVFDIKFSLAINVCHPVIASTLLVAHLRPRLRGELIVYQ